jgi:hypothetical protein
MLAPDGPTDLAGIPIQVAALPAQPAVTFTGGEFVMGVSFPGCAVSVQAIADEVLNG